MQHLGRLAEEWCNFLSSLFPYFLNALFQYTDPAPHQRFQDKNPGVKAKEVKTKTPARSARAPEAHGSQYFKGMAPGQKQRDDVKKSSESETWVYQLQWGTAENGWYTVGDLIEISVNDRILVWNNFSLNLWGVQLFWIPHRYVKDKFSWTWGFFRNHWVKKKKGFGPPVIYQWVLPFPSHAGLYSSQIRV